MAGGPGRLRLARTSAARASQLTARSHAYTMLRDRIVSLELPPGTALSENELAAELEVSRTPVRESLILLADEALVEIYPKLGTFVARIALREVQEAQFVREALELAALRESAPRVTETDISELRDILRSQDELLGEGQVNRFFELDEAFHRRLMDISGHPTAWKFVNTAKAHLDRARRLSLTLPDLNEAMAAQHRLIVNCLAGGDGDGAENMLRAHLRHVFDDIDAIRQNNPGFFAEGSAIR